MNDLLARKVEEFAPSFRNMPVDVEGAIRFLGFGNDFEDAAQSVKNLDSSGHSDLRTDFWNAIVTARRISGTGFYTLNKIVKAATASDNDYKSILPAVFRLIGVSEARTRQFWDYVQSDSLPRDRHPDTLDDHISFAEKSAQYGLMSHKDFQTTLVALYEAMIKEVKCTRGNALVLGFNAKPSRYGAFFSAARFDTTVMYDSELPTEQPYDQPPEVNFGSNVTLLDVNKSDIRSGYTADILFVDGDVQATRDESFLLVDRITDQKPGVGAEDRVDEHVMHRRASMERMAGIAKAATTPLSIIYFDLYSKPNFGIQLGQDLVVGHPNESQAFMVLGTDIPKHIGLDDKFLYRASVEAGNHTIFRLLSESGTGTLDRYS